MTAFTNKVDFAVIFTVNKANPNGDQLIFLKSFVSHYLPCTVK